MGVEIHTTTKQGATTGAVVKCNPSGEVLPVHFDSPTEADHFLDWLGVDPREYSSEPMRREYDRFVEYLGEADA